MTNYNSLNSLYKDITIEFKRGINQALLKGKSLAYKYMQNEWYDKYEPEFYERTYALLESLAIKVEASGNEIIGTLYAKQKKHPKSNWKTVTGTFDDIYEWFSSGNAYGEERNGEHLDVMKYTQEQLIVTKKALQIIKTELNKSGYNMQ